MRVEKLVCAAALAVVCVSFVAEARVQPHALGLRFYRGYIEILGAGEINYQKAGGLLGADRLEIGANIWGDENYYTIAVTGITQWHWNISSRAARGGFNWYVGPGAGAGVSVVKEMRDTSNTVTRKGGLELHLYAGGQIGIEYDFNVLRAPINVSIDTRPMLDLAHFGGTGLLDNVAIAVRYTF